MTPAAHHDQRRLEEWSVWQRADGTMFLIGRVFGDKRFEDGELIRTSAVQLFSFKERTARSMNNVYALGQESHQPTVELARSLLSFGLSPFMVRVGVHWSYWGPRVSLHTVQDYLRKYPTESIVLWCDPKDGTWIAHTADGVLWREDQMVIAANSSNPLAAVQELLTKAAFSDGLKASGQA